MFGRKAKGWLDGWEQRLRIVGQLGTRIKDGWMVGNKDKGWLDGWEQRLRMVKSGQNSRYLSNLPSIKNSILCYAGRFNGVVYF